MTQQEALTEAQAIFHGDNFIGLSREHWEGEYEGTRDYFRIWHTKSPFKILAQSDISWEHCIAKAKAEKDDAWERDDAPIDEVEA